MSLDARPPSIPGEAARSWEVSGDGGLPLRVYALPGGPADGPALLWGHANGFSAGSYLPFLQQLAARFRVFAWDARGHGSSAVPEPSDEHGLHVDRFARDVGQVAASVRAVIGAAPLFFASHSFSGVAAVRLSTVFGVTPWQAMTVFEPPMTPTPELPEHAASFGVSLSLVAQAQRRRRRQPSPEAFAASLRGRAPWSGFRPDLLEAHSRATLHPAPEGDFVLACPPEVEAGIYLSVLNASTYRALPNLTVPVHFVAGDPVPAGGPPSWAALVQQAAASRVPDGRYTVLRGCGHMMIFERPDACAGIIEGMLDRHKISKKNS